MLYGHVHDIWVAAGDTVRRGQPLGTVGNNSFSRCPHVHVGAWYGDRPLQVRFDQEAQGGLLARRRAPGGG